MDESVLLVDPLAALFRTELAGLPPLTHDETVVDLQLVAPLAVILTSRRFTNSSDQLIEAVLTLPPLAGNEICYGLEVWIGGTCYRASPHPAGRARGQHETAVAEGRRAILYELLPHDIPMLAIAGIEAGARVNILTRSIRPLARPAAERARLVIPLSADWQAALFRLPDADAGVTTPERHSASLTISANALQVTIVGQPYPDKLLASNEMTGIECATPICLDIVPLAGGTLDHREWQVDRAGGWEVTAERGVERFRHPGNPGGRVASDRTDWIFGAVQTDAGEIRVTAPLGEEGIAPNARGMRALAAASFVAAAVPTTAAAVRKASGLIDRRSSLAFIGPEGELPDEIPALRKLALARMDMPDFGPEPEPERSPPAVSARMPPRGTELPGEGDILAPGDADRGPGWPAWLAVVLAMAGMTAALWSLELPFLPVISVFSAVMLISAWRFLPPRKASVRRRLPLLVLLPVPWIASYLGGPLPWQTFTGEMPNIADWMIPFQFAMLGVAVLLPCGLIAILPRARRFVLILGLLNLVLAFFLTSAGVITLTPGS